MRRAGQPRLKSRAKSKTADSRRLGDRCCPSTLEKPGGSCRSRLAAMQGGIFSGRINKHICNVK